MSQENVNWARRLSEMSNEQQAKFEEYCGHGDLMICEEITCHECLDRFIEASNKEETPCTQD